MRLRCRRCLISNGWWCTGLRKRRNRRIRPRRHEEIRERHREISREHREISRQHRDVARRQVEDLRQRRAVFHSREAALRAQRRGLELAIRQLDTSLAGELTGEQRQSLDAIKLDLEEKLGELEEDDEPGSVPLPEDLEPPGESL